MTRTPLSEHEIAVRIAAHPDWERRSDRIARCFRFENFVEAFSWMASTAVEAERLNHHPEWRNVHATVEVELTTHDAGGLTAPDFELAAAMDRLAAGD